MEKAVITYVTKNNREVGKISNYLRRNDFTIKILDPTDRDIFDNGDYYGSFREF